MSHPLPVLILLLGCLAISFLLSGMEAGVFTLSRLRIRQLKRRGNRRATALFGYLEKPENFLWTILVGNTLANFVVFALGTFVLYQKLPQHPWISLGLFFSGVFLFYTLFELLPKTLFRLFPNRLTMFFVAPFRLLHLLLKPVVAMISLLARGLLHWSGGRRFTGHLFGNRDELRQVMQESGHGLSSEERVMINRVLDLQNLRLGQVAIPLSQTVGVEFETPVGSVLDLCRERGLTRLPVWRKNASRQRVAGLISVRQLLYSADDYRSKIVGDVLQPALYLPEFLRLEDALRRLQKTGQRLAIVLSGDQREIGIVSLEDILKVIFGEVKL